MSTFLYRINGGEVRGVSVSPTAYSNLTDPFLTIAVDPPTPDGENLSIPKIWDLTSVRNATAGEITAFDVATAEDQATSDKLDAQDLIDTQIVFRKAFKALVLTLIDELNILKTIHSLPNRTLAQAISTIKDKISNEDVT